MKNRAEALTLVLAAWLVASQSASAQTKDEKKPSRWLDSQVELPADFPADATTLPGKRMKSSKKPFRIEPFEQRNLEWGEIRIAPVRVLIVGRERIDVQPLPEPAESGGGFSFVLAEPGKPDWNVRCRRGAFRWLSLAEAGADETSDQRAEGLACELAVADDAEPWRLALRFSPRELLRTTTPALGDAAEGALARAGHGIRVHTSWKVSGFTIGSGFPTGFLFSRGEAWLAAVDAHGAGGLRLVPALTAEERGAVIAAAAALTVYQNRLVVESIGMFE